ncbi:MAG TPA: hypothetical protein VII84_01730, partial [Acidimicrobiales bacterium]
MRERLARLNPTVYAIAVIALAVMVGNALAWTGLVNLSPTTYTTDLTTSVCHLTCGRAWIDPNVGSITQPGGHLAAMDLLHLHVPWWNPFEGLGTPLAGEMQSTALFPLILWLALPGGLVWFHISLELVAGIATYFLARRLGASTIIASVGGALFALSGTYAWIGNAVLNPVALLPMLVLGVEMIIANAPRRRQYGWYVAALALALSLYAGFPEVAYLDALFAGAWAVVRLRSVDRGTRVRTLRRLVYAALAGIALALPIIVPFRDYLNEGYVGDHTSLGELLHMSPRVLPMFFDPYLYGTIFSNPSAGPYWAAVGGYFGASVTALALAGLFGRRHRPLRIFLLAWIAVGFAGSVNVFGLRRAWNLIPLVNDAGFWRYIPASIELAAIVLAVLGLTDAAQSAHARWRVAGAAGVTAVMLVIFAATASSVNRGVVLSGQLRLYHAALDAIPFVSLALLVAAMLLLRGRWRAGFVAAVVVGESVLLFAAPMAVAPSSLTFNLAPVRFLQANLGQYRYMDVAVLYPNWGSEYGISSLAANDLPLPLTFVNYVQSSLFPRIQPPNAFSVHGTAFTQTVMEQQIATHLGAYEGASVKYLLTRTKTPLAPQLAAVGVKRVWSDRLATIYALPDPRPFFSTASSSCTVSSTSLTEARVNCPTGKSTLLRTEQSMMGWTATVNGRPAAITTVDTVYQQITVPKGTSTVEFSFLPPHERLAVFVGFAALLVLIAAALNERVELLSLFRWGQKRTGEIRRTGRRRASIRPVHDDSTTTSKVVIPRSPRR